MIFWLLILMLFSWVNVAKRNLGKAKIETMCLSFGLDWGQARVPHGVPCGCLVFTSLLASVAPPLCLLYWKLFPPSSSDSVKWQLVNIPLYYIPDFSYGQWEQSHFLWLILNYHNKSYSTRLKPLTTLRIHHILFKFSSCWTQPHVTRAKHPNL